MYTERYYIHSTFFISFGQMGLGFGVFMALLLGVGSGWFTKLFTNDVGVLEIMSFILPVPFDAEP